MAEEGAGLLSDLIIQAPYIAALVVICGGFLYFLYRYTSNESDRLERQEERHSRERQEQEERWASRFERVATDYHKATERAAAAIISQADAQLQQAASISALNSKLDTLIDQGRRSPVVQ